jgi:hypothetical protein
VCPRMHGRIGGGRTCWPIGGGSAVGNQDRRPAAVSAFKSGVLIAGACTAMHLGAAEHNGLTHRALRANKHARRAIGALLSQPVLPVGQIKSYMAGHNLS